MKKVVIYFIIIPLFIFTTSGCGDMIQKGIDSTYEHVLERVEITSHSDGDHVAGIISLTSRAFAIGGTEITDDSSFTWNVNGVSSYTGRTITLQQPLNPGINTIELIVIDASGAGGKASISLIGGETVTDDFTDYTYRDSTSTTARWDKASGRITLTASEEYYLAGSVLPPANAYFTNIAISGNYVYTTGGNATYSSNLTKINVTDPANPATVGSYTVVQNISDGIAVSPDGNTLYVCEYFSSGPYYRLTKVNISNPGASTPAYVSSTLALPGVALDVTLSDVGDYAFIAGYNGGMYIVRLSDMAVMSSYTTTGNVYNVAVSGNYAYIAAGSEGIIIIDISDPANPFHVQTYSTTDARGIAVAGNYLYVADSGDEVLVLYVSNPLIPVLTSQCATNGNAEDIFIKGNYAYVSGGLNGITVLDITEKAFPFFSGGFYNVSNAEEAVVDAEERFIYTANNFDGLAVVGLYSPLVETGTTMSSGQVIDIDVSGSYVYAVCNFGGSSTPILKIFDTGDPASPREVSAYDIPSSDDWVDIVVAGGGYSYIVSDGQQKVTVIDVTDPFNPSIPGGGVKYTASGIIREAAVSTSSNILFLIIFGGTTIELVDVSDPSNPVYPAGSGSAVTLALSYTPYRAVMSGNGDYAFVASSGGLIVVDIRDPGNPVEAATYTDSGSVNDVALTDDGAYALLTSNTNGLVIVDVQDPQNPVHPGGAGSMVSAAVSGSPIKYVEYGDGFAYVQSESGLNDYVTSFDLSDITNPLFIGYYPVSGSLINDDIQEMKFSNNYLIIADYDLWLRVFEKTMRYTNVYSLKRQYAQSLSMVNMDVTRARIRVTDNYSSAVSSVIYQLSNDGQTWYYVNSDFILDFPTTPDGTLRWRATLTTYDKFETPFIDNISIDYWTD